MNYPQLHLIIDGEKIPVAHHRSHTVVPFGPVALINPYAREEDMIAEANRLPYGLSAYSWTNDAKRQKRLAREVETGMFRINTTMLAGPDTPFGGVKWSGHGHEDGPEGVMACMVLKTVHEG